MENLLLCMVKVSGSVQFTFLRWNFNRRIDPRLSNSTIKSELGIWNRLDYLTELRSETQTYSEGLIKKFALLAGVTRGHLEWCSFRKRLALWRIKKESSRQDNLKLQNCRSAPPKQKVTSLQVGHRKLWQWIPAVHTTTIKIESRS